MHLVPGGRLRCGPGGGVPAGTLRKGEGKPVLHVIMSLDRHSLPRGRLSPIRPATRDRETARPDGVHARASSRLRAMIDLASLMASLAATLEVLDCNSTQHVGCRGNSTTEKSSSRGSITRSVRWRCRGTSGRSGPTWPGGPSGTRNSSRRPSRGKGWPSARTGR